MYPSETQAKLDALLRSVVTGNERVPGVIAMVTDADGIIYSGAAGDRTLGDGAMTENTIIANFSTTKAITATAALQCVEDGLLDLDAPAGAYLPEIDDIQVINGFDADGAPQLRPPNSRITTRQLLLHTAGFGYTFFDETYQRLETEHGQIAPVTCTKASLNSPLLFDPGQRWFYGISIDWVGQVIEALRGKRLGDVMAERIFEPLGMTDTAFARNDDQMRRTATIHARNADGSLTPMTGFGLPQEPEVDMGGHGLYGTVPDYMRFIRMWLNDGRGAHGNVLKAETVEVACRGGLDKGMDVVGFTSTDPTLTNDIEFFPGLKKDWALSFMVNSEPAPTGRSAGSLAWAGLANCFYWIDRQSGLGGYWVTQILPFGDAVSFGRYLDWETAVYDGFGAQAMDEARTG
ncbi:1,4-butanediol diacrylate esterase [Tateyamaria omphalii]|uniref:serine hydrolase domain-containing protein n=1 Tax=Tateyamaria omphalii TaxID=299262 RepID=UPI00167937F9|nr:serine hydrolase domain-containing protein [Tateyamaria omphalii]GGX67841.1 1,4-butanediol diacrylate esterase [Tateyamaria omphalii]